MLRLLARPAAKLVAPRCAVSVAVRACSAGAASSSPPPPPSDDGAAAAGASSGPSDGELRLRVLEAALLEVPTHGWSTDALTAGAMACELSPMAHGLLPRGPIELVEHFSASCNQQLAVELDKRAEELSALQVHNRLLVAIQTRLRLVAPHAASWPQALALRALPVNLQATLYDGHALASQLLDACGEDARTPLVPQPIDPLVKAISVGAIYGAAELHLLTDTCARRAPFRPPLPDQGRTHRRTPGSAQLVAV